MKNFNARIKALDKLLKSSAKQAEPTEAQRQISRFLHELIAEYTGESVEAVAARVGYFKYSSLAELVMDEDDDEKL